MIIKKFYILLISFSLIIIFYIICISYNKKSEKIRSEICANKEIRYWSVNFVSQRWLEKKTSIILTYFST